MDVRIQTNTIEAKYFFNGIARRQLPFAMSQTVNSLAFEARNKAQSSLGTYFEIRTPWLKKKGAMPVIPSRKGQYPNIFSILAVKDEVAALAATGGTRNSKDKAMAVPFSDAGEGKGTRDILNPASKTLPRSLWPGRIARGKSKGAKGTIKPFMMKSKTTGKYFVAQRVDNKRYPLDILYGFKRSVTMKKTWPLIDETRQFVSRNYDRLLTFNIDNAIRTLKRY